MSGTEKLRELLDERGTEYYPKHADETVWTASDNAHVWACDDLIDGYLEIHVRPITPAQAVEATLGRGTCHDTGEDEERFCCSECGSRSHIATEYRKFDEFGNKSEHFLFVGNPRFCPSCGRKVVDA